MFPTISEMSELGLTGYNGTNPIELFGTYKKGFLVTGSHKASGDYFECGVCGFYSTKKRCNCPSEHF